MHGRHGVLPTLPQAPLGRVPEQILQRRRKYIQTSHFLVPTPLKMISLQFKSLLLFQLFNLKIL